MIMRVRRHRFVRIGADERPVFLTGDLGQFTADECLIHLGRKDFQVKIRGYRVELGEIEHALAAAPGVLDAVSWIVKNRRGEDQLVAYVLMQESGTFDRQRVEAYLEARLPDYMVPRQYVVLDRFPVVPTGKIDRQALPNPFEANDAARKAGSRARGVRGTADRDHL